MFSFVFFFSIAACLLNKYFIKCELFTSMFTAFFFIVLIGALLHFFGALLPPTVAQQKSVKPMAACECAIHVLPYK